MLSRDPARITLAQVRAAARSSLRFPAQQPDDVTEVILRAFQRAESAAEAALDESLESLLLRFEAPAAQVSSAPETRPVGVGQSVHKPA